MTGHTFEDSEPGKMISEVSINPEAKQQQNVNGRIRTCAGRAHMISSHAR